MSTTLETIDVASEIPLGLGTELRIRIGETVEEMRSRFDDFIKQNPDLIVEQDPSGEIVIMSPAGAEGSSKNSETTFQVTAWSRQYGGIVLDISGMIILPNGAKRSPDSTWIDMKRWEALSKKDRKKFPHIAPDFVLELRSETDRLSALKKKLQEYIDNGVRLAWLVDPQLQRVHIYRPGHEPEVLDKPSTVSGGDVLPGFVFDLKRIFADA